jgi:hypothetical protein
MRDTETFHREIQDIKQFPFYFLLQGRTPTQLTMIHRKKKVREFPVPSQDVTTRLSLGGNNDVITELFLPRGSLVSDIPAGDGKLVKLFLRCSETFRQERRGHSKTIFSLLVAVRNWTHSIDPNTYVRLVIFCRDSECRKLEGKTSSGASSSLNTNFPADFYPIVSAAGRGASSQINF